MIYLNAFLFAGFICMLGQLIMNFGNMLYQSGINGYENAGILGIFSELLDKSSLAIVSAIIFAFIISIIFKAKK